MTIKKPMKAPEEAETVETVVAPMTGGATIADRFKLDLPDSNAKKASTGVGTICAVIAGVLALGAAGLLTFILYSHLEFFTQNA